MNPRDVTVDASGFVYVADSGNERIQKFTSDGQFLLSWIATGDIASACLPAPEEVAVDSDGFVYVYNASPLISPTFDCTERIQKFSSAGMLVETIGGAGSDAGKYLGVEDLEFGPGGKLYVSDAGNDRLQVFRPIAAGEANSKAIVVAGGGPFPGNALWDASQAMANFAFRTLTFQGFVKQNIFYLSDDTDLDLDGNGVADDVDAEASETNLENAIVNWAADADDVVVYLTDHGGDGRFRISATDTISAVQMDAWLDQLQTSINGKVTVIYDACESGSFVGSFQPPTGKNRVIITSSSPNQLAYFTGQGALSFSNFFWMQILNGKSVGEAYAQARTSVEGASTPQFPLLDADGNGVGNEQADLDLVANQFVGGGVNNFLDAPTITSVSAPQVINATSTATITASGVSDADGIGRVWAVLRPPNFTGGSTDNPVTAMPEVEMVEVSPGSGNYAGTFTGFTTPGAYQLAIYALDGLTNTSLPKLTSVSVGNPLTRRAVVVLGGQASDPTWPAYELAGTSTYQSLRLQGYQDTEIAFYSATTVNAVAQLNTLLNLEFALSPGQHGDSQDVVVVLIGAIKVGAFQLNGTQSVTASALDTLLDALQGVLPGKLTVVVDAAGAGSYVDALAAPAGGEESRYRIAGTTGAGPALFEQGGAVSFSRQFWQQVSNGARLRAAFIQGRNAMELTSGFAQRARLDADGDGDSDKFDLAAVQNFSLGPGILLAGDAPLIGKVNDPVTLTDGGTTAALFAEDVTTTGIIARVFAVITPPTAAGESPSLPLPTVALNAVGNNRYEASYGGFGVTSGVYQVAIFAEDDEGVVSLPAVTQVIQKVGADVYEPDNQASDASVIVSNAVEAQAHTVHSAADEDWVQFYGIAGQPYEVKAENVGANADLALQLFGSDRTTQIGPTRDDAFAGGSELLTFTVASAGVYYIRVSQFMGSGGIGTSYDLRVDRPVAPDLGTVVGLLKSDVLFANLAGASILAGVSSALTLGDGSFEMRVQKGTLNISVTLGGYQPAQKSGIQVIAGQQVDVTIPLTAVDADADGLADIWEQEHFGNLNATAIGDVDGDGLNNAGELTNGTLPLTADTDADGLPDGYEVANGFRPRDPSDASLDADNDGFTTLEEFAAGTDPRDPLSTPRNTSMPWLQLLLE